MSVRLAMGLGNFGAEYANTRHNVGMSMLARLADVAKVSFSANKYCAAHVAKVVVAGKELLLASADSYMNLSGESLAKILKFYKIRLCDCVVIYDDINMPVGRLKLSKGGSAGGHNGVADIMTRCGNDFARIRIGIGAKIDKRMDLAEHVLGKIPVADAAKLASVDIEGAMALLVGKGLEVAQNILNRRDVVVQKSPETNPPESKSADARNQKTNFNEK